MSIEEKELSGRRASGDRVRLDSLTSLRFLAALIVFASHVYVYIWYTGADPEKDPVTAMAVRLSLSGVSFFFLLSGFVLTWSARAQDTPRAFWRRRLAKIAPNHLVTWLVAFALLLVVGERVGLLRGLSTLLLVDAWIPDQDVQSGVNPVSWSLGCELFFYLCFPFLNRWISLIQPKRLWYWAAGLLAAIAAVPYLAVAVTPAEPKWAGLQVTFVQHWLSYNFPPTRLLEFVLGMVLARIVITGQWYPTRFRYVLVAVPVGYLVALQTEFPFLVMAILVVPLALLVLAAAHSDITGTAGLRRRSWVWLGDISFAFYMTHLLVILYLQRLFNPQGGTGVLASIGYTAAYLVISVFVSWLLYRIVERPFMRRWGTSRRGGKVAT